MPDGSWLGRAEAWKAQPLFGQAAGGIRGIGQEPGPARAAVRGLVRQYRQVASCSRAMPCAWCIAGQWDLEPFGRLRFRFEGQGSGHVVSLWAVDVKGDGEAPVAARATRRPASQEISVPISFEGNDVFDPGHVVAICLELDEGNVKADQVNRFAGAHRRARCSTAATCSRCPTATPQSLAAAKQALAAADRPGRPAGRAASGRAASSRGPGRSCRKSIRSSPRPSPSRSRARRWATNCTAPGPGTSSRARSTSSTSTTTSATSAGRTSASARSGRFSPRRRTIAPRCATWRSGSRRCARRGLLPVRHLGLRALRRAITRARIAPEHHEILLRVFGDRFLGYDNGEQDGRYIGGYAGQRHAHQPPRRLGRFRALGRARLRRQHELHERHRLAQLLALLRRAQLPHCWAWRPPRGCPATR